MRFTVRNIIFILTSTCVFLALYFIFHETSDMTQISARNTDGVHCGRNSPCPPQHLAFLMHSGAASVVGPKLCLEENLILSNSMQNVGEGLNILFADGRTGKVLRSEHFNMYSGDVSLLIEFMKDIPPSTFVFVLSYDDAASKLTPEVREIFQKLGSTAIKTIAFRDSWLFIGATDIKGPSPFEVVIKNDRDHNKYEGWPERANLEGCIPLKQD
uniref:protein FAM3C-like n=1 Tax=Myxine glutinosa TaxID=7769 RepID=UPI00358F9E38